MRNRKSASSILLVLLLTCSLFACSVSLAFAGETAPGGEAGAVEAGSGDGLADSLPSGDMSALQEGTAEGTGAEAGALQGSSEEGAGIQSESQVQTLDESVITTLADITVNTEEGLADALLNSTVTDIEVTGNIVLTGAGGGNHAPFTLMGTKNVYSTTGQTYTISRGVGFEAEMFSVVGQDDQNPAILTFSNIILDGTYQKTLGAFISPLIKVTSYGTLHLNEEAVVRNNPADEDGGGIYNGEGEVIINGGKVINNSSAGFVGGGGIYNNGKLTLISGVISGNDAPNGNGGGVYNMVSFEQQGGEIANNTAFVGGGVSNRAPHPGPDYAEFDMSGGSIANNSATEYGGGIDNYGYFTLVEGTISGNSCTASTSYGGAIVTGGLYSDDPSLSADHRTITTILGGAITNNSAAYGGGICAYEVVELTPAPASAEFVTINFSGGTIANNTATTAGGGMYIMKSTGLSKVHFSGNPQMTDNGIYVDGTLASALIVDGTLQASARILVEGSSASDQMVVGALVANRQAGTGTLTEAEANTFMSLDSTLTGTLSGNSVIWKPTPTAATVTQAAGVASPQTDDRTPLSVLFGTMCAFLALAFIACGRYSAYGRRGRVKGLSK